MDTARRIKSHDENAGFKEVAAIVLHHPFISAKGSTKSSLDKMDEDLLTYMFPIPPGTVSSPIRNKVKSNVSKSMLILGEKETFKTSLLLQAAIQLLSKDKDATILYIAAEVIGGLTPTVHLMSKFDVDIGNRLFIYYFGATDELIKFIADYHTRASLPIAIMIDDLHKFVSSDYTKWMQPASKVEVLFTILRNLIDLASWISSNSSKSCHVFAASQEDTQISSRMTYDDGISEKTNSENGDDYKDQGEISFESQETNLISTISRYFMTYVYKVTKNEGLQELGDDEFFLTNEVNSLQIVFKGTKNEILLRKVQIKKLVIKKEDENEN